MEITWLASYPRSGNTFLRTILFNCFGIKTASIYPNDLGRRKVLEDFVGHIEHNESAADAAKRETFEETMTAGIALSGLSNLSATTEPTSIGKPW